jgi:hypothetical protein
MENICNEVDGWLVANDAATECNCTPSNGRDNDTIWKTLKLANCLIFRNKQQKI